MKTCFSSRVRCISIVWMANQCVTKRERCPDILTVILIILPFIWKIKNDRWIYLFVMDVSHKVLVIMWLNPFNPAAPKISFLNDSPAESLTDDSIKAKSLRWCLSDSNVSMSWLCFWHRADLQQRYWDSDLCPVSGRPGRWPLGDEDRWAERQARPAGGQHSSQRLHRPLQGDRRVFLTEGQAAVPLHPERRVHALQPLVWGYGVRRRQLHSSFPHLH